LPTVIVCRARRQADRGRQVDQVDAVSLTRDIEAASRSRPGTTTPGRLADSSPLGEIVTSTGWESDASTPKLSAVDGARAMVRMTLARASAETVAEAWAEA
jgi:hypothetical protein